MSAEELAVFEKRQRLIRSLAETCRPSRFETEAVAEELGLTTRSVRRLVMRFRAADGNSLSLVSKTAERRPGKRLLSRVLETLIHDVLTRTYLTRQRPSFAYVYRRIEEICHERRIKAPSQKAVRVRLLDFDPVVIARRRHGAKAAQALKPVTGHATEAHYPLHIVQIDHTKADVMLVDSTQRKSIGRPFVTFAIDLYSRCIVGLHVSLEPPSAATVALCLVNIVEDKDVLLQQRNVEGEWPIAGVPRVLHLDNGQEFHSRALMQGAALHGMELRYRPPAKPWYGGTIESRIKRFMSLSHNELPGTTYSNPQDRGEYPSEKLALLTLKEMEHWLLLAIIEYHAMVQDGIHEPPIERLKFGLSSGPAPVKVQDRQAFTIDFLPLMRRKLRRDGFHIDHFTYYNTTLDYYIVRRSRYGQGFEIRRDPRNLGFIWVKRPDEAGYIEVSMRDITQANIMLWEHKAALKELRERNIKTVNQDLIIRTAKARREIIAQASMENKKARRNAERLKTRPLPPSLPAKAPTSPTMAQETEETALDDIVPFEDLEVTL